MSTKTPKILSLSILDICLYLCKDAMVEIQVKGWTNTDTGEVKHLTQVDMNKFNQRNQKG